MKHLVFGTGLIGGFLGGGLLNAKLDVVFLGRQKQRQAMQHGLTVSALTQTPVALPPPNFYDKEHPQTFDVIWLTVKCTAVAQCVEELKPLIHANSIIICCQNGFGSDRVIEEAFPDTHVISATVGFNVAEIARGHLHRSTDGALVVESHTAINTIIELLNCELLPSHVSQDITADRWAKLQLNLANPVNALADIPTKAMTEDRDYRVVIAALMSELLQVTKAMGLALPRLTALPARWLPTVMRLPDFVYLKIAQKTLAIDPTARVSMWWDLSQGRQSEILFLNQAVVEKAREYGFDCPYNKKIVDLILEVESGQRNLGLSGKALQKLIGLAQ